MIRRIFLSHPQSVGEGYWEHFGVASGFGAAMLVGGAKAMVHAVLPNLCKTSGSDAVRKLHADMVRKRSATAEMHTVEWMI